MTMRTGAVLLAATVAAAGGTARAAFMTTIDAMNTGAYTTSMRVDYSNPGLTVNVNSNHREADQTGVAGVLTGHRYSRIDYDGPLNANADPLDAAAARISTSVGNLAYSSAPFVLGKLQLLYRGVGSAGMSHDFSAGTGLGINLLSTDLLLSVGVTITSHVGEGGLTQGRSQFINVPGGITNSTVFFDFANFSGIDLHDVDYVDIFFTPQAAGDFAIGSIGVVPEPASLGLLGLGAVALLRRRR